MKRACGLQEDIPVDFLLGSASHIQSMLNAHGLGTDKLVTDYSKKLKDVK